MALTQNGQTALNAYDYDSVIRERFSPIDEIGTSQNNYAAEAAQRRTALAQQSNTERLNAAQNPQSVSSSNFSQTGAKGNNFNSFMNAIVGKESGGNYSARNKDSGAMGKYQVMPGNIAGSGGWDKEALGYNISSAQFMASPELQDKIAQFKLKSYFDKYGPAGAAVAWYAGPGMVGKAGNGSQGAYPTINAYSASILRKMGL